MIFFIKMISFRRLALKARFGLAEARSFARAKARAQRPTVQLEHVQRRLELLLTAMYGRNIPINSVKAPNDDVLMRAQKFLSLDARARETTPIATDDSIQLPIALSARDGVDEAVARYRLLAIEQAERVTRGTVAHAPLNTMERDLYLIREGAAVDAKIARANPGMLAALQRERTAALARRPPIKKLSPPEREVELLLRAALANASPRTEHSFADPEASRAWARETAAAIRRKDGLYRGIPPASLWGTVASSDEHIDRPPAPWEGTRATPNAVGQMFNPKKAQDRGTDQASAGAATDEAAQRQDPNAPQDRSGSQNPRSDSARFEPSVIELPEGLPPGIPYDEWDSDAGRYVKGGATVRFYEPPAGDGAWSADTLHRHAALVRQVRHNFERLRARRTLLGRQRGGDELDIAACVDAIVDRHVGNAPDDRLYLDARPARRGMAISLLMDISGSTETKVTGDLRIIDLEKIAVLLASEALDALGDLYAVHAFNGKNAYDVKLTTVKDFGERNGEAVRSRVAALTPAGFTRIGAAIRHSTHQLARQAAGHRLLLILSDGRPNDVDRYQGDYGVEDTRQAIVEARASGVFPFCLTVDRDASEYLPRIFGTAGHTILQRPQQLPTALLGVVRALIGC